MTMMMSLGGGEGKGAWGDHRPGRSLRPYMEEVVSGCHPLPMIVSARINQGGGQERELVIVVVVVVVVESWK